MRKLTKRSIILVTIITLTILIGIVSTSRAVWEANYTAEGTTTYNYNCFNLTISGGTALNNVTGHPVSDAEGLASTPYTFTIRNTCPVPAVYDIVLNEYTTNLPDAYVKVAYKDSSTNKIYRFSELRTTEEKMSDAVIGKVLTTGVLNGNASKSYSIYSWIDEKVEADQIANGNTFTYKVSLNATSGNVLPTDNRQTLSEAILANNEINGSTPNFAYSAPNTSLTSNQSGLFEKEDDLGTSYYFRGNVTNNYVKFGKYPSDDASHPGADMYWRIVRINGDDSVRLIYDGTTAHANGESTTDRRVGTSAFNSTYNNHKYVGYTYDNTYDEEGFVIRGTDSTIKKYLDNWYKTNIIATNFDGYVAEEIYCNDTTTSSGSATSTLYYGSYGRNYKSSGNAPILTCPTTDKTYGGKYKFKVGLISADELAFAGFGYNSSSYYAGATSNYLYMGSWFWTGSPYSSNTIARVFGGNRDGFIYYYGTNNAGAVRPVINLRSDIRITNGDGTKDAPYEIDYSRDAY